MPGSLKSIHPNWAVRLHMHRYQDKFIIIITVASSGAAVTTTTKSSKNGATTLSRVNMSVYVGHATIFS